MQREGSSLGFYFPPSNLVSMNISGTWKKGKELRGHPEERAVRGRLQEEAVMQLGGSICRLVRPPLLPHRRFRAAAPVPRPTAST